MTIRTLTPDDAIKLSCKQLLYHLKHRVEEELLQEFVDPDAMKAIKRAEEVLRPNFHVFVRGVHYEANR